MYNVGINGDGDTPFVVERMRREILGKISEVTDVIIVVATVTPAAKNYHNKSTIIVLKREYSYTVNNYDNNYSITFCS